jgi:hypothetical protein
MTPETTERMARLMLGLHARDLALEAVAASVRREDPELAEEIAALVEAMAKLPVPIPFPMTPSQGAVVQQEHADSLFDIAERFRRG